jgi:hypothetical protein
MTRNHERQERAREEPIVGGLPDVPGIGTAIRLTPGLGVHLRGLADELLVNEQTGATEQAPLIETVKLGSSDGFGPKMQALLHIARTVRREPRDLTSADVEAAQQAGATDADVQLAVLIASAFSMYNRMVEGFRARTAPTPEAYRERATEIATGGYSGAAVTRHRR